MSIVLERLSRQFGSQRVVDDVSLQIGDGELFVLLGASGSGKSTILRMIAGLTQPDSGRIMLHGKDVTALSPQRRGAGFVFQNYSIFRHMTVEENIDFGLRIRRVARAERARRRDELLELMGLGGLGGRHSDQLSGGQQQRVAIARALAYQPNVLLLDEPFGALDVKIRQQLRRSLREIQRRLGITTILVTHDQDEAFELADRVGVVHRGRLMEVGPAEELYTRPHTLFAATFLGAGTVVIGRAEAGHARLGPLSLPIPPDIAHEDGAPVQILFRPEEVDVSADRPEPGAMVLGRGDIVSQNFSAAVRRLRVRIPPLAHTRQVSPPTEESGVLIDAVLPSSIPPPEGPAWVSLKSWHILEPPTPSILVYDPGRGPRWALAAARELARSMGASVTVLGVAADAEDAEAVGPRLERRRRREGLALSAQRVRFGHAAEEVAREQGESLHEMIVMSVRPRFLSRRPRRLDATLLRLIGTSTVPLLLAVHSRTTPNRVLLCPSPHIGDGSQLRAAGRALRRMGAKVTLLRTDPPAHDPRARPDATFDAKALAEALGCECEIRQGGSTSVSEAAMGVARAGDHDLVAVCTVAQADHEAADETARDLLMHGDSSVLVIPVDSAG